MSVNREQSQFYKGKGNIFRSQCSTLVITEYYYMLEMSEVIPSGITVLRMFAPNKCLTVSI